MPTLRHIKGFGDSLMQIFSAIQPKSELFECGKLMCISIDPSEIVVREALIQLDPRLL